MLSSAICSRVLARALRGGGTFAEIFFEDTRAFGMTLRSGKIENAPSRVRAARASASMTACAPSTSTPAT